MVFRPTSSDAGSQLVPHNAGPSCWIFVGQFQVVDSPVFHIPEKQGGLDFATAINFALLFCTVHIDNNRDGLCSGSFKCMVKNGIMGLSALGFAESMEFRLGFT